MTLVTYSGSESDGDSSDTGAASKPLSKAINLMVFPSSPQKVHISLPNFKFIDDEPPAKKPRIGGSHGSISNFNAMLPAPENLGKQAQGNRPSCGTERGPRLGVSLKTGAEPMFERSSEADDLVHKPHSSQDLHDEPIEGENFIKSIDDTEGGPAYLSVQMKKRSTAFKPLSVTHNKKKKKKTTRDIEQPTQATELTAVSSKSLLSKSVDAFNHDSESPTQITEPTAAKSKSLFSMSVESFSPGSEPQTQVTELIAVPSKSLFSTSDDASAPALQSSTRYEPLLTNPLPKTPLHPPVSPTNKQPTLDSLANSLNLSASQRRQIFGKHAPDGDVNLTTFDMAAEYRANEQLRASGEITQPHTVRTLAPGKHSLKQLVQNVEGQREALEESFAEGRRKKGAAGARYGWNK